MAVDERTYPPITSSKAHHPGLLLPKDKAILEGLVGPTGDVLRTATGGELVVPRQTTGPSEGSEIYLQDPSGSNGWRVDNYGGTLRIFRGADVALTLDITAHTITLGASWLLQGGVDSGWVNITSFGTGWAAFNANWPPQYRKLSNGMVMLRGLLAKSSALTLPETMVTLPAGFRPVMSIGGTALIFSLASAAGYAEVRAYDSGPVQLQGGGSNVLVSLAGAFFMTN